MPMRPIKAELGGKLQTVACCHWRTFPPLAALGGGSLETQWQEKRITPAEMQRGQVWQRVCGLLQMDMGKCGTCKFIRRVVVSATQPPMLVSLDGLERVPIIDKTFLGDLPQHRGHLMISTRPPGTQHSTQDAAWVGVNQRAKEGGGE